MLPLEVAQRVEVDRCSVRLWKAAARRRGAAIAPELNPVELIWGHAKTHPLANFAPLELHDLVMQTQLTIYAISDDESLLRSFIQHCSLSLRP